MSVNNISKYVQLTDFLLLEYEFNKSLETTITKGHLFQTDLNTLQYFDENALGTTNNTMQFMSIPLSDHRNEWFYSSISDYYNNYMYNLVTYNMDIPHDTIKLHIISGYDFSDIEGFLLQIRAQSEQFGLIDFANFTWRNQQQTTGKVIKFSINPLQLGNKFYDKYIEFSIPSISFLSNDRNEDISNDVLISRNTDVNISYSNIITTEGNTYIIDDNISLQLPLLSKADSFNAFIHESDAEDYIEFYATWNNNIIGTAINDIENGIIPLYTSNDPNANYEDFTSNYGVNARKWVVNHELYIYEQLPNQTGGTSLLTQKFSFMQDELFNEPNYFRPVLRYADLIATFTIEYICRLSNRMDGTQIIRKASFASPYPKKYGKSIKKLNVNNIIPLKVFNKIETEQPFSINNISNNDSKYIKIYVDTTNIKMIEGDKSYNKGNGPLYLNNNTGNYKFVFTDDKGKPYDFTSSNYVLVINLSNGQKIISNALPTNDAYNGNLLFTLNSSQISSIFSDKLSNPNNSPATNIFSIMSANERYEPLYTVYQGLYYNYSLNTTTTK